MTALAFSFLLTPTYKSEANFSPSLKSISLSSDALDQIRSDLEYKKVVKIFKSLGYDDPEIQARMRGLDSGEIRLLAGDLENSMVPSGDGSTLLILGSAAVVLFFILVFIFLKELSSGRK
jgi:hypothetical protein